MKTILKTYTFLIPLFILSACQNETQGQEYTRIDNSALQELLESHIQLLDVRTPGETSNGIISGAEIIDFYDPEFKAKVEKLNKKRPIAVYCAAGGRSAEAGAILIDMGFTKVYDLENGYRGWSSAGFPTVSEE